MGDNPPLSPRNVPGEISNASRQLQPIPTYPMFSRNQGVNLANLTKLSGTNYRTWREMIFMVLQLRGLLNAVSGLETNQDKLIEAKLTLYEAMDDKHQSQVLGCPTARDIIERLDQVYADDSAANVYRLIMKYYRYQKAPTDTMFVHIGKMDDMRRALANLGKNPDEEVYQVTLLGSLPPEYDSMLELWELTHPTMKKTSNLVARLLKREEDLLSTNKTHQALATSTSTRRYSPEEWKKLPVETKKKLSKCKTCGNRGHWSSDCKQKESPAEDKEDTSQAKILFNVS